MDAQNGVSLQFAGWLLVGFGIIVATVAGLADVIGIGTHPSAFGYRQLIGTALGLLSVVIGVALVLFASTETQERP